MRLGLAAVLSSLLLAACPEPAQPGFDPSNPRPLDESLRKPPPPGTIRPDEPTPPPRPKQPEPPPEPQAEAPPPQAPDAAPSKEDLSAKFSIKLGAGSPLFISVEGDSRSATVREVKGSKDGEASLKTDQLKGKEVAAFLAALDKLEWWKLAPNDSAPAAQQVTISRGGTYQSFAAACAKGKSCPNAAAEALIKALAAKAQAAPPTKVLKFKAGATAKGAAAKAHCADRERPNYVTCVADSGTLDHCTGKGKKFVCFQSPFDPKGLPVSSDVAPDEKKKAPAASQPWAIELAAGDRCVATQGRWKCDHDTEVTKVSTGKTWLAWPGDGPPVPVKAGYAE